MTSGSGNTVERRAPETLSQGALKHAAHFTVCQVVINDVFPRWVKGTEVISFGGLVEYKKKKNHINKLHYILVNIFFASYFKIQQHLSL